MLESLFSSFGEGGAGLNGPKITKVLKELQGLRIKLVAGAAAGTAMAVADLRQSDTLVSALAFNAGVPADVTASVSINSTKAKGTITGTGVLAGDTVTVNGTVYTYAAAAQEPYSAVTVLLGASDAATAANLAARINAYESRFINGGSAQHKPGVTATQLNNVVTVTATADGVGGNTIALASSNGRLALSGATLAGGNAGGITSTTALAGQQVVLVYFDKDNLVGA